MRAVLGEGNSCSVCATQLADCGQQRTTAPAGGRWRRRPQVGLGSGNLAGLCRLFATLNWGSHKARLHCFLMAQSRARFAFAQRHVCVQSWHWKRVLIDLKATGSLYRAWRLVNNRMHGAPRRQAHRQCCELRIAGLGALLQRGRGTNPRAQFLIPNRMKPRLLVQQRRLLHLPVFPDEAAYLPHAGRGIW